MNAFRFRRSSLAIALLALALCAPMSAMPKAASAAEIAYIVNKQPITSYDIDRRVAFLRLQQRSASRPVAAEEMVNQTLRLQEMARLKITVPEEAVTDAYNNFAKTNKISPKQLDQILAQSGVTKAHFRQFIRTQIGWNRAVAARFQSRSRADEQAAVRKMIEQGGQKPSATEYLLQQVILVVPQAERSKIMAKRKREAETLRGRFQGCDSTRDLAKGMIDVTVRNLGRVIEPELPTDWKEAVTSTAPGHATKPRETERGVEFIGVCSTRQVSDDRVAQLVLQRDGRSSDEIASDIDKKYLAELRERATIVQR